MSRTKKIAILAIIAMVMTLMPAALFAATADSDRLAGAGRVETGLEIASAGWTTASTVILAPADQANLVDALAAAPLAGQENAPILLTFKGSLDAAVKAKIAALGATKVYVIGAISDDVVAEVTAMSGVTVEKLSGASRWETADAINAKLVNPAGTFVVGYDAIPDALSAASYAAKNKFAIVLAKADGTVDSAKLVGATKYIVGGTAKVADIAGVERMSGADRFATNAAVAAKLSFSYGRVYVANGLSCVDALAVAPLAAKYGSFVILSNANSVSAPAGVNSATKVVAVGGTNAVSNAVKDSVYVAPASLAVESIAALNLNFIKVVFTQEVDEAAAETPANYTLGGVDLTAADNFDLQSDKKTLYISLDIAKAQYETAIFKIKGNVVYSKDLLTTVPANEATLTFSDVTTPTVSAVTVSGNSKLTVEFSEPVVMTGAYLAAAGTNFKIDGQNIVNYGFTAPAVPKASTATNFYVTKLDLSFATALPAGSHTLTVAKGTATDLIDAAKFKVAEQTISFTVATVTNAPQVVSVTGENNGTIYVTYDRKMDANALVNTNYVVGVANPAVGNPSFKSGSGDKIVKMTIAGIVKGANILEINKGVKDVYGNKLDADNNVRVSFTATEDVTKPVVTSVTVITNTKVRVKFSEDVALAYASNVSNYTLKDSSGVTIAGIGPIASAPTPGTNSDTYELTVPVLTGSNYTLKIKNVVDLAANPNRMDDYTATFNGNDDVAPTVASIMAVAGSTTKVAVVFSEKMDASTTTNLVNYYYEDNQAPAKSHSLPSGTAITAGEDNKSVQITFPSAYAVNGVATTEYSVKQIRVANVKDAAGNLLAGVATPMTPVAAAGSGTDNATYSAKTFNLFADSTKVWAEFEMNQAITSLNIADFTVAGQAPDTGYMSGKKVVLNFTNAAKINAIKGAGATATLATVATASTNIYGTPIAAIAGTTVYDDQIAPKIDTAVAITTGDGTGTGGTDTVTITFTENIDPTVAGLYKDDFTFERGGVLWEVGNVTVVGRAVTFELKGIAAAGDNFAAADGAGSITVKAIAANITIKDMEDAAENQNLYVPATADKNGTLTVTP